jgi:hypothetical protein
VRTTRAARCIDRIQQNLRRHAKRLPAEAAETRAAIAAALRYIRSRKDKMRYASYYRQDLAIGSGAKESTCWLRVPGVREHPDRRSVNTCSDAA